MWRHKLCKADIIATKYSCISREWKAMQANCLEDTPSFWAWCSMKTSSNSTVAFTYNSRSAEEIKPLLRQEKLIFHNSLTFNLHCPLLAWSSSLMFKETLPADTSLFNGNLHKISISTLLYGVISLKNQRCIMTWC